MNTNTPVVAFIDHIQIVRYQLARLTEWADDHGGISPDEVTWADAAGAAQVCNDLGEIVDFVFQEGEYAEEEE